MQRTSAPQISALKLINMSNLSLENTSHVWFVAPEIHLKQVKCDNGLASFKQPHHVGCVSCEENKIQVFGNPILDDDLPLKTCWSAPRGTAHVDMHHLKLKIGYMVEKANISRSFRCPNRLACMGGEISTEGFGEMCAEGYRGQGCVKCEKGYGSSDSNRFVCVACASSVWRQRMQMGRFVLEDLLLFALSVSGVASTSGEKESKILTNHFMSFVAAAGPVIQAVQETPTFKRIMSHLDVYVEGLSTSVEAGEGSGSSAAGGMSARCIQGYLNLPKNWWCRALLTLFTPFCAIAALMAMRGWRIAAVVGVNCFLPKACLCFARYLVCYRMEPEHEGGELFCAYRMYTGFSLLGLLLLVAAIACSGPVLWWRLLSDKSHSDAPYYLYLSASYKEDLKSWEVTRLVRKVFLAVICAALPVSLHPAMQIMCISLVLLTALILEMQFRPYKDSFWNLEEKTLLTVSLAMVSVTSCYLANEYHWSSTYRTQQFLLLVILVLSIVPTNVLVFQIIVQLLRERGFLKSREAQQLGPRSPQVPWRLVAFLACLAQAEEVLEECRHVELLQHAQQLQRRYSCSECVPALFVVTSSRTGSTTVLHMLNLIPGYDIKGENYGLWSDIYGMNKEREKNWKTYRRSSLYAWHHSSGRNDTELECSMRLMLLGEINPNPLARVVGFRESMWRFDENLEDLAKLLEVFPCAKVVMSYRKSLEDQLLSQSFALGDFQYFVTQQANQAMKSFAEAHRDRVYSLAMEDLDVEHFNKLLAFLGEDHRCEYVDVVHANEGRHFTLNTLEHEMIRTAEDWQDNGVHMECLLDSLDFQLWLLDFHQRGWRPATDWGIQLRRCKTVILCAFGLFFPNGAVHPSPLLAHGGEPLTPDMALCCGADMMATKVSAEKPMLMAHLVEDFPVAPEFLTSMSGQLLSVQQVIEDVNLKIAQLQEQINSRLGQQLPREVTRQSGSEKISLPENFRDLDIMVERESNSSGRRKGIAFEEPSPEDEEQDDEEEQAFQEVDDDEDSHIEELKHQFARCDVSSNGWVSGDELLALALNHGEQLTLQSVLKLCTYLAAQPTKTRVSKRYSLVEEVSEEQLKKQLTVREFLDLRANSAFLEGAAQDIVETAEALNRALDEENRIYKYENDRDTLRKRHMMNMVRLVMDVGIVAVIAVNAVCIGVSADHPGAVGWEILELVFFGIYFLEFVIKAGFLDKCNYWVGPDWSWNVFDFMCLLISGIELSISYFLMGGDSSEGGMLSLLKVLRLARLARLVRVMRFKAFKELKLMALGLFSGLRALLWALVLLISVIFTISVVMQSLFKE
ncbi:unnamed protein product [Durusdinium trenchii]|uniref:EF-hand domain-containing protein n=1 Tax=Durusdinium trenchii TaxID=1381693 RepID=A0ABP0R3V2_9DINO